MTQIDELSQLIDRLQGEELGGEVLLTLDPAYDPYDLATLMGTPSAMVMFSTRLLRAVVERSCEVDVDDLFPSEGPRLRFVGLTEEFGDLPEDSFPEEGWYERLIRASVVSVLIFCSACFFWD
ncbi:MAG: hypothetical protein AAF690_30480 [Acidobacteriota bacterium]